MNPATGDFYETATDLALPGAGLPLEFTRTYDAQAAQAEVSAGTAAPPLGYGWAYNLGMSLTATATTATVTEEDGSQLAFTSYDSGTSPAWCTSSTNFCSEAPRVEATLNENSGGTWSYVRTLGTPTTFTFSSSGALTEIADEQGDTLTSSAYSPSGGQTACPSADTCTAWTSSASGRELVLAYNSSGELTSVFDANSTLAATFAYSGSGCSTWSGSETPDLCEATRSRQHRRELHLRLGQLSCRPRLRHADPYAGGGVGTPLTSTTLPGRSPSRRSVGGGHNPFVRGDELH